MNPTVVIIATGLFFYLLTCVAIVDLAFRDFGSTPKKAIWAAVAMIPFVGCLVYFVFGLKRGVRKR